MSTTPTRRVATNKATAGSPEALAVAAVEYAQAGWAVFPLRPGTKDRFRLWKPRRGRGASALHVAGEDGGGFKQASADPELTAARWARWPSDNIGLATGRGVAVVDIDPRNGGSVEAVAALGLPLDTLTARTPGGGVHLYYRYDERERVPSRAGVLAEGVDVKADGGYVLAPPSRRAEGVYEWVRRVPMRWVEAAVLRGGGERGGAGDAGRRRGIGRKRPEDVRPGERHDQLLAWGGWLAAQEYDEAEVVSRLRAINARFPVPMTGRELDEIDRIAAFVVERERAGGGAS